MVNDFMSVRGFFLLALFAVGLLQAEVPNAHLVAVDEVDRANLFRQLDDVCAWSSGIGSGLTYPTFEEADLNKPNGCDVSDRFEKRIREEVDQAIAGGELTPEAKEIFVMHWIAFVPIYFVQVQGISWVFRCQPASLMPVYFGLRDAFDAAYGSNGISTAVAIGGSVLLPLPASMATPSFGSSKVDLSHAHMSDDTDTLSGSYLELERIPVGFPLRFYAQVIANGEYTMFARVRGTGSVLIPRNLFGHPNFLQLSAQDKQDDNFSWMSFATGKASKNIEFISLASVNCKVDIDALVLSQSRDTMPENLDISVLYTKTLFHSMPRPIAMQRCSVLAPNLSKWLGHPGIAFTRACGKYWIGGTAEFEIQKAGTYYLYYLSTGGLHHVLRTRYQSDFDFCETSAKLSRRKRQVGGTTLPDIEVRQRWTWSKHAKPLVLLSDGSNRLVVSISRGRAGAEFGMALLHPKKDLTSAELDSVVRVRNENQLVQTTSSNSVNASPVYFCSLTERR